MVVAGIDRKPVAELRLERGGRADMAVVSAEGLQVPVADRDLDPPVVVELLDLIECGAAPFPWEQSQPVLDPRTADSGDFRVAVEESLEHFEGAHDFQIARKVVVSGERSEERRVGNECVRTGSSRWAPYH